MRIKGLAISTLRWIGRALLVVLLLFFGLSLIIYFRHNAFYFLFIITIISEIILAFPLFRLWLKQCWKDAFKGIGYVFIANLVSYPVIWIFIPSLGRFQTTAYREIFFIPLNILFGVLLFWSYCSEGVVRLKRMVISFIVVVVFTRLAFAPEISTQGLSIAIVKTFAEIFAILFEAMFIYEMSKKTLSIKLTHVIIISCVMNISSYLICEFLLTNVLTYVAA